LAQTTEELTCEVDTHQKDLHDVGRTVGELELTGDLAEVQTTLLAKISHVIETNQRLEDELVCARHALEQQAKELDRTRREALIDSLSGVANRKGLDETLQFWLAKLKRRQEAFSLVLIDADHFKWINDAHGDSLHTQTR
jgi:diguanylate cyclase